MIFSQQLIFSDQQAVTATALSENVIDLGTMGRVHGAAADLPRDIGKGTKIPILVQVTEDFATLTSLTISIRSADVVDVSTGRAHAQQTIPVADLVAGTQLAIDVLPNQINGRYLGLQYAVNGSDATTGKITAGIVYAVQTNG